MHDDDHTPIRFGSLGLDDRLLEALDGLGFEHPTPIQARAIPLVVAGRDVVGRARTGSGKTAAFGLGLLQRLLDEPTEGVGALVLAPTRELACQVSDALASFARKLDLKIATVYGGSAYPPQIRALERAAVVVGTPGRLLDHLDRGTLDLGAVRTVVLDEADEMLRMGFLDDVERLLAAAPPTRQLVLFSATMPDAIRGIADRHQRDPVEVQVEERAIMVGHIDQVYVRVPRRHRLEALVRILRGLPREAALVFARTRVECAELADALVREGVPADALHGDLSQAARERVVKRLRARQLDVVVATDVAARGLDVEHVTHVINLEMPRDSETYVHRIGRTGRVGRQGMAILFCTPREMRRLKELERAIGQTIAPMEVPSDAQLREHQRAMVASRLREALHDPSVEVAAGWVDGLAEELGVSLERLAAAALARIAREGGATLAGEADPRPPVWSRPPSERPKTKRADCNEVELFFPLGRKHGVRPGDLVGALANEGGVDGAQIGRVNIFEYKSFVGLSKAVAEDLIERVGVLEIRGVPVRLTLGWGKPDQRRERAPRGAGRNGKRGSRGRHRRFRGR